MAESRAHLIALPPGFVIVRILQTLFALVIIPLDILMIVKNIYNNYAQLVVLIIAVITLIAMLYINIATYVSPNFYNYWALLGLELFFLGAWAIGFIHAMGGSFRPDSTCIYLWDSSTRSYEEHCVDHTDDTAYHVASYCSYVVIGLAGSLLVLWLASFITVCVGIAKHRKGGGHCVRGSEKTTTGQETTTEV